MEIEKYVITTLTTLNGFRPELIAALRDGATGYEEGGEIELALTLDCTYTPARAGGWDGPDEPADVAFTVRAGTVRLTDHEVAALWPDDAALNRAVLAEVEGVLADSERDFDPCDLY